MSDWDPMKEQFHSDRNKYSVNIDDPSVAMLGYGNCTHSFFRVYISINIS